MEIQDFLETYDQQKIRNLVAMKVPFPDIPDVVQEIYVQIALSIHTFRGESKLATWVDKIIRNTIVSSYYRPKERLTDANTELTWEGELPEVEYLPAIHEDIGDALSFLPDSYREVLILHFWGGRNFKQISSILALDYEAVRSRYRRGLAYCRKNMDMVMDEFTGGRDIEIEWTGAQVRSGDQV